MADVGQSKLHSFYEAIANNVIAFSISVFAQWAIFPLFDIHISITTNIFLVLIFTGISIVRSYFLRRFFNWIHHQKMMSRQD